MMVQVEGQMNERICATALYYLDSENVTPSHLSFRMQTRYDQDELQDLAGQDQFNWLERVYGTELRQASCLQYYGSAETRQGRLLAFPNVLYVPDSFVSQAERSCRGFFLRIAKLTILCTFPAILQCLIKSLAQQT